MNVELSSHCNVHTGDMMGLYVCPSKPLNRCLGETSCGCPHGHPYGCPGVTPYENPCRPAYGCLGMPPYMACRSVTYFSNFSWPITSI